jgi:protein-S-isoprenylcysteine O-methyltransferase Ste14
MGRTLALVFGAISYGIFFLTFLYLIGFVGNLAVPKSIDSGMTTGTGAAWLINVVLLALFGIQHSVMARPAFKKRWMQFVPAAVERSTFVLLASLVLILLYWQWRPMTQVIWSIQAIWGQYLMWALFFGGFTIVLLSTFVIDHFDLFGLRQVMLNLRRQAYTHPSFKVTYFYRFVRHPLYSGFLMAFWATPQMTLGHLLFAVGMTTYILIAIRYEERDLILFHGQDYVNYRASVPMLVPRLGRVHQTVRPQVSGQPGR